MSDQTILSRLEAAIATVQGGHGRGTHLALIVMRPADLQSLVEAFAKAGHAKASQAHIQPPHEFSGITIFEDDGADRSYLFTVDGKAYPF